MLYSISASSWAIATIRRENQPDFHRFAVTLVPAYISRSLRSLPELSVQMLALFNTGERLTLAQMEKQLGANRNTLKVRLRELVAAGRVKRHGKARATWHTQA